MQCALDTTDLLFHHVSRFRLSKAITGRLMVSVPFCMLFSSYDEPKPGIKLMIPVNSSTTSIMIKRISSIRTFLAVFDGGPSSLGILSLLMRRIKTKIKSHALLGVALLANADALHDQAPARPCSLRQHPLRTVASRAYPTTCGCASYWARPQQRAFPQNRPAPTATPRAPVRQHCRGLSLGMLALHRPLMAGQRICP